LVAVHPGEQDRRQIKARLIAMLLAAGGTKVMEEKFAGVSRDNIEGGKPCR
jgi:hypothetical protein